MAITRDLPQLENKKEFAEAKNSVVVDDQGNKIGTLLNNNDRILVESGDISPYMKEAAVAIEDRRFYEHGGVDWQGMVRAGVSDLIPGGSTQGASTITEQFVKNALEAQGSRTVFQKFREAALAYQIERHWDKDKILTEYLNTIYFGEGAYGIEAAAHTYFGWNHPGCGQPGHEMCAKDLTPPEAAMLAGIISSPSAFSPRINPQAAMDRRNLVLQKMVDEGDIDQMEYEQGIKTQLPAASEIAKPSVDSEAPYFTSWLRQQIVDLYGPGRAFGGGLDGSYIARHARCRTRLRRSPRAPSAGIAPTASVVVLDNETGGVKAMVGGNDYEEHPFNLATNGHRQPGSAFKPFTLATALTQGISPSNSYASNEKIFKVPHSKNEYFDVHNYADEYYGSSSSLRRDPTLGQLGLRRAGAGPDGSLRPGVRRKPGCPRRHQADRPHRPPDGPRDEVLDQPIDDPRRDRPGRQPARDGARLPNDRGRRRAGRRQPGLEPRSEQQSLPAGPGRHRQGHRPRRRHDRRRQAAEDPRPVRRRRLGASGASSARTSSAAPVPRPSPPATTPGARRGPQRTTATPGSAEAPTTSPPASGSATPTATSR